MKTELKIEGMSCGHCVKAVETALKAVDGVKSVHVSLEEGKATVEGLAVPEQMIAAVVEEGYAAQVIGA